jgi:hypothetical protein
MPRLTESEARALWERAVPPEWKPRWIYVVMFDWPPGKPTRYDPNPPASYSIADASGTVDVVTALLLSGCSSAARWFTGPIVR